MANRPDSGIGGAPRGRAQGGIAPWAWVALGSVLGAGGGWWIFGPSPLILLGFLFGFLASRTVVGLLWPEAEASRLAPDAPLARRALAVGIAAWVFQVLFWTWVLDTGLMGRDGSGLPIVFLVLPVTALFGMMGETATGLARRALRQIDEGFRPESDREPARWALRLGRLMTIALWGFLAWLLVGIFS